ncbi:MAG: hypothetical protein JWQ08_2903 [Deinococcus sp.]|nr:hypothetical protein [Deinococcus sp.]
MVIRLNREYRPQLRLIAQRLLTDIQLALMAQPPTSTWGPLERHRALILLQELSQDWETQGVRVDALQELGQLSHQLDMVAATLTRANLEALRGHVRSVLDAAATDLEHNSGDPGWYEWE